MLKSSRRDFHPVTIVAGSFSRGGAERQAFLLARKLTEMGTSACVVAFQVGPHGQIGAADLSEEFPDVTVKYLAPAYVAFIKFVLLRLGRVTLKGRRSAVNPNLGSFQGGLDGGNPVSRFGLSRVFAGFHYKRIGKLFDGLLSFRMKAGFETKWLIKHIKLSDSKLIISFLPDPNGVAVLAALARQIPVIISERNDVASGPESERIRWIRHNLYPYADLITANTIFSVEGLKLRFPEKRLLWQPNQQIFFTSDFPRGKFSFDLTVVSRLVPQKRLGAVIEALAILHRQGHRLKLKVFGQGPEEMYLKQLSVTRGLTRYVTFYGYVPVSKIYENGLRAGFFVSNSAYEGSSNSLHEAVASGFLPIIANTVTEVFDILGEPLESMLITDGSAESIAQKVSTLIESEAIESIRKQTIADFVSYWRKGAECFDDFAKLCIDIVSSR